VASTQSSLVLRACGFKWDWRKARPYCGYDQFDFEIPTATQGDCYARAQVRVQEMRQSLRIIQQCVDNMPDGPYKSLHPLATPPIKEPNTMHHIETLIHHSLGVSWGPVIPPGEAACGIESSKGNCTYYLVSDGNTVSMNNFVNNSVPIVLRNSFNNSFDTGCRGIGNHWSGYRGADDGTGQGRCGEPRIAGDGIGDSRTPHATVDFYPIIARSGWTDLLDRVQLDADILPKSNNAGAKGNWVSVKIHVPDASGFTADDIDVGTLVLYGNHGVVVGTVNASNPIVSGGPAGLTTLHVKFDRQAWSALVMPGDFCYAIQGRFLDGTPLLAVACVRITNPP